MRQPGFWYAPPGALAAALAPLSRLYGGATARRLKRQGYRAAFPVICVGNVTVGGAGKTPTVIHLIDRLKARGISPWVVSRGYGGTARGPLRVDPARDGADRVGDEALLLAAFAPVVVARDRAAGVRLAEGHGAMAVILDDGLQNPSVTKDLSILAVDAETGFGNGRVIPAGPLREPVAAALGRTDLVLTIGGASAQQRFAERDADDIDTPWLRGRLAPLPTGMPWDGLPVLAFAGIARPAKFFATLAEVGARTVRTVPLSDHQPLSPALIARLEREAQMHGAQLVTTEKDAVRLPSSVRPRVLTLPVRLTIEGGESPLDDLIEGLFPAR